jgi:hypothetical protein
MKESCSIRRPAFLGKVTRGRRVDSCNKMKRNKEDRAGVWVLFVARLSKFFD